MLGFGVEPLFPIDCPTPLQPDLQPFRRISHCIDNLAIQRKTLRLLILKYPPGSCSRSQVDTYNKIGCWSVITSTHTTEKINPVIPGGCLQAGDDPALGIHAHLVLYIQKNIRFVLPPFLLHFLPCICALPPIWHSGYNYAL